ncbi:nucleotidyltransferase family protein [Oleiagrimonas sp. C23AA]|uniref:nucleotidyltransferase family protein n=1 Tax=Oleiagrimonas sp. C23AA TaxID=2719047 RepID=UPI001423DE4C|nr:nucleotidyltransferase family protein [Oleiagrimonas sp. C23AA]NII09600.1 nucleotidyltransferase family protein [Oleiagrimonas sp. C23AA]
MLEHDALLLAAGGSRRLGHSKARLRRDGEALITRSARVLASQQSVRRVAVLGHDAEALADYLPTDWVCVTNAHWQEGMASSLQCGLAALATSRPVLVAGIDQPGLDPSHIHALLSAAGEANEAAIVSDYGGAFGLPALLPRCLHSRAGELSGDRGFKPLIHRADVPCVHVAAPELALDVDTAEDLDKARQRGWIDT